MIRKAAWASLIALFLQTAMGQQISIQTAAARFLPDVKWLPKSVVTADFTCQGRKQQAILESRVDQAIGGIPEALPASGDRSLLGNSDSVVLKAEGLDYNPKEDMDFPLPGFRQSKTCKGLNLSDGETDASHLYWNHDALRFDMAASQQPP